MGFKLGEGHIAIENQSSLPFNEFASVAALPRSRGLKEGTGGWDGQEEKLDANFGISDQALRRASH